MKVQDNHVAQVTKSNNYLRLRDNEVEQRDRDPGWRIFEYKIPDKIRPVELANKIYDDLLEPMFIKAAEDGLLRPRKVVKVVNEVGDNGEMTRRTVVEEKEVELPLPLEVIEFCHVLPGGGNHEPNLPVGSPPPAREPRIPSVIVKSTSRNFKSILHKYKKDAFSGARESIDPHADGHNITGKC